MPLEPEAEKLYRSAMRLRLTRAGLVKIMRENEARELTKISKDAEGLRCGSGSDSVELSPTTDLGENNG